MIMQTYFTRSTTVVLSLLIAVAIAWVVGIGIAIVSGSNGFTMIIQPPMDQYGRFALVGSLNEPVIETEADSRYHAMR